MRQIIWSRWAALLVGVGLLVQAALADDRVSMQEARDTIQDLQKSNQRLRDFAKELLPGKRFSELTLKNGKTLTSVSVMRVEGDTVHYETRTESGSFSLEEGPQEWALLIADEPKEIVQRDVTKPGDEVSNAIVVIEGDAGVGTGFMVRKDGQLYLYTAAHVLSGNRRLAVKLRSGRKITKFGAFEASEGADLVRIEVEEVVDAALQLASALGQAKEGDPVLAAGNSGGGGTVGYEAGDVKGVGPESIEINAEVIQGNSGGPILDGRTHKVLGLVTHLMDARKDKWAEKTRYSDIRRFGCRLDREWKWKRLPIGEFLKEGQKVKEVTDLNELAIIALQPDEWGSPRLRDFGDHMVVKEIRALREWIEDRRKSATGVSESDQKKKVTSLFQGIRSSSRGQLKSFHPENYVWYHREAAKQALELRKELDEACREGIDEMR